MSTNATATATVVRETMHNFLQDMSRSQIARKDSVALGIGPNIFTPAWFGAGLWHPKLTLRSDESLTYSLFRGRQAPTPP